MIKFCKSNSIKIEGVFIDDCSGKDFIHPAYQEMEEYVKKNHKKIDYILVAYWDRFARNIEEAFIRLSKFAKIGVEVNCTSSWVNAKDISSKLLNFLPLIMAQIERKIISARIKDGKKIKAGRKT